MATVLSERLPERVVLGLGLPLFLSRCSSFVRMFGSGRTPVSRQTGHHGGLRHVSTVRPAFLPQSDHQPHSPVRIRGLPDHRLSRHENIALEAPVRAGEPLSAAFRHSANPRHPVDDLFSVCTLIDFMRQGLFAVTVNRNRGRWFELVWDGIEKQIKHLQEE